MLILKKEVKTKVKKVNYLMMVGRCLIARGKGMQGQRGEIDVGGILIMGVGMVFLAVGFIMYPIVMTATDALLAYSYADNATCQASYFTGFTPIVGITPLLVLIGYLSAAVFAMYLGVKIMKGAAGGTNLDLGTMLLLGISLIFIAIGLIILPWTLDAICSVLHNSGAGISASYTGLSPILRVTPLLVLVSFIAGAVISGFFGIKKLTGGGD